MKKLLTILSLILLLVTTGCEKDPNVRPTQVITQPPAPPTPPLPPVNQPNGGLMVNAGDDKWLPLPANSLMLNGYTNSPESAIEGFSWKHISGPASYVIETPLSKNTKIANLDTGIYVFEFSVKLKNGIRVTDTIVVNLYNPRVANANEYIFQNLKWQCPMGCSLLIENLNLYIPVTTPLKVYIKTGNSTWIEVLPDWNAKYSYGINDNYFVIYSDFPDNEELPVQVKITF